jgi:hypothetical protein
MVHDSFQRLARVIGSRPAPLTPPGPEMYPGSRLSLARFKNLKIIFNTLNGTHV